MDNKFSDHEAAKAEDKQNLTTADALEPDEGDKTDEDQTSQAEKLARIEKGLKIIIIVSVVLAVLITIALIMTIYLLPVEDTTHYGVMSESSVCSGLGRDILQSGGSAVDAAITTALCVGSLNPKASGIGGCGVMLVRNHATNHTDVFDFFCTAPNDTSGTYTDNSEAGLKVAVPGTLRGLQKAHSQYGKMNWKDVVMPVVNITKQQTNSKNKAAEVTVNMTALAEVLRLVAEQGVDVFYTGNIAKEISDEVMKNGGTMTVDDLKQYKAIVSSPVVGLFQNRLVETAPAPSSGPLLVMLLNTMQEVYHNDSALFNSTLYYQYFAEAMKFAFAAQPQLGDPTLAPAVTNVTRRLTSAGYGGWIAAQISPDQTVLDASYYADIVGQPATGGTSHISVIDNNEILVSVSLSLHSDYGSGLVTPSGIVLNDYMTAFSTSGNNQAAPGKRPVSTLTPAIVSRQNILCENRYVIGAAHGNNAKISGVADVIVNNAAKKLSLDASVKEPTVYCQLDPDQVTYESGLASDIIDLLKSVGHTDLKETSKGISWVDVLAQDELTVTGYADPHGTASAATYQQQ